MREDNKVLILNAILILNVIILFTYLIAIFRTPEYGGILALLSIIALILSTIAIILNGRLRK